jgi:hypothetical protein
VQAEVTRCGAKVDRLEAELKARQLEARGAGAVAGANRALGVAPMDVDGGSAFETSVTSRRDAGLALLSTRQDVPGAAPVLADVKLLAAQDPRSSIIRPEDFSGNATAEPEVLAHILKILKKERSKTTAPSSWKRLKICDVHDDLTLKAASTGRNLKPDLVVTVQNVGPNNLNAVSVIEVKSDDKIGEPETIGQVAEYLDALMAAAPWRKRAMGILISSTEVRFFRWFRRELRTELERRVSDLFQFDEPSVFRNVLAVAFGTAEDIAHFSAASDRLLAGGFNVERLEYLGSGASSVCVAARWEGSRVVVKLPNFTDVATVSRDAEREKSALRALAGVGGVPKLVEAGESPFVVLSPVADAVAAKVALSDAVLALATTLREVHRRGWVHCDVRSSNVCFTTDSSSSCSVPLLIDFGCARQAAELDKGGYSGTCTTASQSVIQLGVEDAYMPQTRHDMESLVKLAFLQSLKPTIRQNIRLYVYHPGTDFPWIPGVRNHTGEPVGGPCWQNVKTLWRVVENAFPSLMAALAAARQYHQDDDPSFLEFTEKLRIFASNSLWH